MPKKPRSPSPKRPRKWLSHSHQRFCSYLPVSRQSPLTLLTDPTTHEESPASHALIRDVNAHATVMLALVPFESTVTLRRFSDELRISKCPRLNSISDRSSALPRHESVKSRKQSAGETLEWAKSVRNFNEMSPSSFGELWTRITGAAAVVTLVGRTPVASAAP